MVAKYDLHCSRAEFSFKMYILLAFLQNMPKIKAELDCRLEVFSTAHMNLRH